VNIYTAHYHWKEISNVFDVLLVRSKQKTFQWCLYRLPTTRYKAQNGSNLAYTARVSQKLQRHSSCIQSQPVPLTT